MSDETLRAKGKNPEGGLNEKGREMAKAQGHDLKRPVSSKQAEDSPTAAKRRASFKARMCGMKKKMTSKATAEDPNSRINLALKKWDVRCSDSDSEYNSKLDAVLAACHQLNQRADAIHARRSFSLKKRNLDGADKADSAWEDGHRLNAKDQRKGRS